MMNTIRTLFSVSLLFSMSVGFAKPGLSTLPRNYVVLLDLSDRLLTPGQARRDQALIQAVFVDFEQRVKKQLVIGAKDRFRIVIAPQHGIDYDTQLFIDALYLDLSTVHPKDKLVELKSLGAKLPTQLSQLYALALLGKHKPSDFKGSDLWQYANEQLPTDLDPAYDNRLVVLTDGYFDFENNTRVLKEGNRRTDSQMLDRLRKDPNWSKTLALPSEGLIPIRKPMTRLSVCVVEVRAKFNYMKEPDLLTALWAKWLREMHIRQWAINIQASLPKSLGCMATFLK